MVQHEYVDLNISMERACGDDFTQYPWHPCVMTITTKIILLQRTSTYQEGRVDCKFKIFDGLELMQLQGFDMACLRAGGAPDNQLSTHMGGNMFNAFMLLPFFPKRASLQAMW